MEIENKTFSDRDEYQRKPIAEQVIKLLNADIDVSPLMIDGSFGIGKSEFCIKLIDMYKSRCPQHKLIYVDAFKADHADEPLLTLLAAVAEAFPEKEKKSKLLEKAIPVAKYGLKIAGKTAVSILLRQNADKIADDYEDVIEKVGEDAINAGVASILKDHEKINQNISALKECLTELAIESPIVMFVDELDRCRPDFSLTILESIKHIFDVKNVQFVLISNLEQLKASISHRYGGAIDPTRYLDKFLGYTFSLPTKFSSQNGKNQHTSFIHFQNLIKNSKQLQRSALIEGGVRDFIEHMILVHSTSLRESERWFKYLEVVQILTDKDQFSSDYNWGVYTARAFGVFLFCFHKNIANELAEGKIDPVKIAKTLGVLKLFNIETDKGQVKFAEIIAVSAGLTATINIGEFKPRSPQEGDFWTGKFAEIGVGRDAKGVIEYICQPINLLRFLN